MTCSICNQTFQGFGNNAHPINNGRCCDDCNTTVIQTRIKLFIQSITSMKEAK
jgi:hypothetical protein